MKRYRIQPYRAGGWVLVEISNGLELFVFDEKSKAEQACLCLNRGRRTNSRARHKEEAFKEADEGRFT